MSHFLHWHHGSSCCMFGFPMVQNVGLSPSKDSSPGGGHRGGVRQRQANKCCVCASKPHPSPILTTTLDLAGFHPIGRAEHRMFISSIDPCPTMREAEQVHGWQVLESRPGPIFDPGEVLNIPEIPESVIGLYMQPALFLCPCTLFSLLSAPVEEVWEVTWEGCGCRGVGAGQVGLREAGRPQTRHIPPAQHPPSLHPTMQRPRYLLRRKSPPQKTIANLWSAFHPDWLTIFTLCTYKSPSPTLFALPTSLPPTLHILLRFPSSHSIPNPPFIVHHQPSQPRSATHHRPQSFCSHHHFYPPSLPLFYSNHQHPHNGQGAATRHTHLSYAGNRGAPGLWSLQSRLSQTFGT